MSIGCDIDAACAWSSVSYLIAFTWLICKENHSAATYLLAVLGVGSFFCHTSHQYTFLRALDGASITTLFVALACTSRYAWSRWTVLLLLPFYLASLSLPDPKFEIWLGQSRPHGVRVLGEDLIRAILILVGIVSRLNRRMHIILWLASFALFLSDAYFNQVAFHVLWHVCTAFALAWSIQSKEIIKV